MDFWIDGMGFHFDGASWTHKTNLCDPAGSATAMAMRRKSDGLTLKCTTKGKKEGYGVKW